MFCPKCGIENPDNGKFCRSCGTDIGLVSAALAGKSPKFQYTVDPRKRGVSWEVAVTKICMGAAVLSVALILGITGKYGAENWWFWLLLPAFGMLGSGIAQVVQLKKLEKQEAAFILHDPSNALSSAGNNALPPAQTGYVSPHRPSIYKTEDLVVPPSVTENTTRHLEISKEGDTMNLPKSN
jgi:hypothetical protein